MEKLKTLLIANRGEIAVRHLGNRLSIRFADIIIIVGSHLQNGKEAQHQNHCYLFGSRCSIAARP